MLNPGIQFEFWAVLVMSLFVIQVVSELFPYG